MATWFIFTPLCEVFGYFVKIFRFQQKGLGEKWNNTVETIHIQLINEKAYGLIKELEELNLIRVVKKPSQLSALRKKIRSPMSDAAIDRQLNELRSEWQRDI